MRSISNFLSELKKRHVYRVAVAYAVVAWVVIEASSIVVPELMLPSWITRAVIVLALLGFPLALVLAWAYDITPHGVQRTPAGSASSSPQAAAPAPVGAPARAPLRVMVAIGAVLLVSGSLAAWALVGRDADVPSGEALLAQLVELAETGRNVEAFELAARAAAAGANVPDSVSLRFTDRLTIVSEPAGARVRILRFEPGADPERSRWIELGRTPLRGVAVARGDYLTRIEADGHARVERMASSARTRSFAAVEIGSEVQLEVRLLPMEQVPEGMVYVPGTFYRVASRDLQSLSAELIDFFIDRHEVTNARYSEFVDAGGYTRPEYWVDLADAEGASTDAVRRTFVDRTGLPGPREWSGQRPRAGSELEPVGGVSWYEAAAYCRFRRAQLPTFYEWEMAARDGWAAVGQGIEMPWGYVDARDSARDRANFEGSGPRPVGSYPFGMSAFGALDMAGNVKEWLRNRSESGRAVTGGSWEDPIYVFSEVGTMNPASSSPTVGFRCSRIADVDGAATRTQGDGPLRLTVETPTYHPVDAETFALLRAHYHYDRRPLHARVEDRVEDAVWIRERITYDGPGGERVIAYLYLPKTGRPPYQTMVYVASSAAFYGNSVARLAEERLGPLVRAGRALFTVVFDGMTERPFPPDWQRPASNSVGFRDLMVRHATELRLGLDYLESRDEIDMGALAYVGNSWGAGSRLPFAAVDDRFSATVLIGAGIDERVHPTLPEASNINFAPYIRGPKLVVNGREDEEHPWLTRALPLWNLLSEPKELALFDGVGHLPPTDLRIPAIRDFLDRHLQR